MERRQLLATIRVTSLGDAVSAADNVVTLREAITSINLGSNVNDDVVATGAYGVDNRILFDVAGTILLTSSLPAILNAVVIDGRSAPGFNAPANASRPVVTVDGGLTANNTLRIAGPDVAIRSLAVVRSLGPGVLVSGAGASGALLAGNHIGVNAAGTAALPNGGDGILFTGGAGSATIGGVTTSPFAPGEVGNVVAGNLADNVSLDGAANVRILGNFIGTDRSGTVALGSGGATVGGVVIDGDGVQVLGGSGVTVGGVNPGEGNLISGNTSDGVELRGASGVLVAGNRIGSAVGGDVVLANGFSGVNLRDGSVGNTVGGRNAVAFALSAGNLISGNDGNEVLVEGPGSSGNRVVGNFIGTNAAGTGALPSTDTGVELRGAPGNTVGGTDPALGNLISGNRGDGILISGAGASANLIQGNRIGTDAAGSSAVPNLTEDGIEVNNARANTIGGAAAGAGNLISGNANDAIRLRGAASANLIQGNRIGTDISGMFAIPNGANGVELEGGPASGPSGNTVGGVNAAAGVLTAGNLISANARNGVVLSGPTASGNLVLGNFVGTDVAGTRALGNAIHGIVSDGASANTIGGVNFGIQPGRLLAGNLVSGNGGDGIRLGVLADGQGRTTATSVNNLVLGNFVGTDAAGALPVGNAGAGVALIGPANTVGGVSGNTVGGVNGPAFALSAGNLISGNARVGLRLSGPSASANLAIGNFIGTDAAGGARVANGRAPTAPGPIDVTQGIGIVIEQGAAGNVVGAGNLVSGNVHSGVVIDASPNNLVTGSRIGTNAAGTAAVPNGVGPFLPNGPTDPTEFNGNGVLIRSGSPGNTVGGENASAGALTAGNLISGNVGDGVSVRDAGSSGVLVAGNRIGTDASGSAAVPNDVNGVEVAGAAGVTVGGVAPGRRNQISGNGDDGVEVEGGASGAAVLGNYIGTNTAGTATVPNLGSGVLIIDASANLVAANLISGNADGVRIIDALATLALPTGNNRVVGNFIGTDAAGAVALGNRDDGVQVVYSSGNTIGGVGAGEANLISGNVSNGVVVGIGGAVAPTTGNLVLGNLIGTNAGGSSAIGNGREGVLIVDGASANTVGGVNAAGNQRTAGNLISGNGGSGVRILGDGSSANLLLGNSIGTDSTGGSALGNAGDGVRIEGRPANTVGGTNAPAGALTAGNLISGNGGDGVRLLGAGASANLLLGNFVGTDAAGAAGVGNLGDGIRVASASGNSIGVNGDGARNVISGNRGAGIAIEGAGASLNVVAGNRIGTNAAGSAALGNADGIRIGPDASNNAVGAGNVISGNLGDGVRILGAGSTANAVAGNFIGLGADGLAPIGNGRDGVRVEGASGNTIASNVASSNAGRGIALVGPGTTANVVQANRIGTGDAGRTARGNGAGGILVDRAAGNVVGGPVASEGNIVSGNGGTGIVVRGVGASGNLVAGNVVGVDATGQAALGNAGDGVALLDGASGNTVGGVVAAAGNIVSGNRADGVVIAGGSSGNLISGNLIGSDAAGDSPLGNAGTGLRISDSAGNTVGGRANLISGNGVFGVAIAGPGASGNLLDGNVIGPRLSGEAGLGEQQVGVVILDASGNTLSGGNLIGGHSGDGLQLIGAGASGNVVDGNFVGTDEDGRGGLGNARGVFLDAGASANVLRANVVSGNRGDGFVLINGSSGNTIAANLVGLAGAEGAVTRGNVSGILIVGAHRNTLDSNIFAGNSGFGVALAGASGNVLSGNLIGVGPGGASDRPNALHGVMVLAATANTLSANVVSGNRLNGVELRAGASENVLDGNRIGVNREGTAAIPNAGDGVLLDASSGNRLVNNVVSGNGGNGATLFSGSTGNVLVDNVLGTNAAGSAALPNRGSGLLVAGSSDNAMARNVASGNLGFGIAIAGGSGNIVADGLVGTDRGGSVGLGNSLVGVLLLNTSNNSVLNSTISSNGAVDARGNVRIEGPGASGNRVAGNRIGTDSAGTRSLDVDAPGVRTGTPAVPGDGTPTAGDRRTFDPRNDGVVIAGGASANVVGGAGGDSNLISGNRIGVYVRGQSARNVVLGNRVGTDASGAAALANGDGVIVMNSSDNTIGGTSAGARNVISGNFEVGVRLTSIAFDEPRAPASGNVVAGNYVGTNAAGDAAIPNRQGIYVYGASGNRIGLGSYADPNGGGNLLSGNVEVGLQILNAETINAGTAATPGGPAIVPNPAFSGSPTTGNVVAGNRVGTDAAGTARVPNFQGIFLSDAPGNTVADNLISGNVQVGLNITGFNAVNNAVAGNRIGPDVAGNVGAVGNGFGDPNGLGTGLFLNQVVDNANPIAPTNDIRGNVGAQIRPRPIAAGPFVEGVIPVFDAATGAVTRLDVRINGYLSRDASVTLSPSNYAIAPVGGAPIAIASISYDEIARIVSITPSTPLPAGQSFVLTLVGLPPGGLRSRPAPGIASAFLDGNNDGRAGDNFTQVVAVPARTVAAALTARAIDLLADADDLP